ncbi:PBP1A family penicillin-binding protein [Myxococcota bacterium]|nr:PBP1A family penicillin-binding protein [Myxococcota bacterium]
MTPGDPATVRCENPRPPGLARRLAGLAVVFAVAAVTAGALAGFVAYVHFSRDLPEIDDVEAYHPPGVTRFWARDGRLVGEMTTERRIVVPLENMPRHLLEAFLAAEDQRFFEHGGVDVRGVLRAALANWRAGRVVEGASTITQQLCKTMVGSERSLTRKIREAILARRLESRLGKLDILFLYLNQIYLGHGAYGVEAAARLYFGKGVEALGLAEASMLAGLPPRPSTLNPVVDLSGSKARQRYVLDRMVAEGFITAQQADQAFTEPLAIHSATPDVFGAMAPDFVEHVRRTLQENYGGEALNREGFDVWLTVDLDFQQAAHGAVQLGLWRLAERQGYTGPLRRLDARAAAAYQAQAELLYAGLERLSPEREYLALVESVERRGARVRVGPRGADLPLAQMAFAAPYDEVTPVNDRRISDATRVLQPGDVVLVRGATPGTVRLSQEPRVQGALVSLEPRSGAVRAMIGGFDFDQSEYNRAFQGCRQPGSVFKPLVYSRALDMEYTLATPLSDTPVSVFDAANQLLWKPRNSTSEFLGDVLLFQALSRSMNIPAIKAIDYVGPDNAVSWARHLGITTPLYPDRSLVLGSSCVYPWDMAQVYAVFALRGQRARPAFVSRVTTRRGEILEDRTHVSDPWAPATARIDALLRTWNEPRERVMDERTAFLMQRALRGVVEAGTATEARSLGVPVAGKTGTTDAFDAWFMGFTESLVTGVWIGSDRNTRKLGGRESGGRTALPVWLQYMRAALRDTPQADFTESPPPGIVFAQIDAETGKLAAAGRPSLNLPFKEGTVPVEAAPAAGTFDRRDVDVVEGRF